MPRSNIKQPNEWLKYWRNCFHLTQQELADQVDVTLDSVQHWEYEGRRPTRRETLDKLALLFGKSIRELGFVDESEARYWKVDFIQNPYFTGRESILSKLSTRLPLPKPDGVSQPVALIGMGGIGKTQIALEYAYRHRREYDTIVWLNADTEEVLTSDFASIARLLDLPEKDEKDQKRIIAVKTWLKERSSWLLIFDNVSDFSLVEALLPTPCKGHIILTTQRHSIGTYAQAIQIDPFSIDEGTIYLLNRAKLDSISDTDYQQSVAIVQTLDLLPLALDQAGAYIEETSCGLTNYLTLYQTHRAILLAQRGDDIKKHEHPEPITATLSLAFEKVHKNNPGAFELLKLFAFLHPEAIPEELISNAILEGGMDISPVYHEDRIDNSPVYLGSVLTAIAGDAHKLDTAIKELLKYSLVRRNIADKIISIHRLVQAVMQDRMDKQTQRKWAERTVRVVNQSFPNGGVETWPLCRRYLPHALVCRELIIREVLVLPEAGLLMGKTGNYFTSQGDNLQAQLHLQGALLIDEKVFGKWHPNTAACFNSLAYIYTEEGKYEQAESFYEIALLICEKVFKPYHPNRVDILNNLAGVYRYQGKYQQAVLILEHALMICEQILGSAYLAGTANTLNNLAGVYRYQDKYEQAEPLYQRALSIREKALGLEHPDTAFTLNNLASVYMAQGKYEQAESLYQNALSILEKQLSPEHSFITTVRGNYEFLIRSMKSK